MNDLKTLRAQPELLRAALENRQMPDALHYVDDLIALDEQRRANLVEVETFKRQRNESSQEVARRKRNGENADDLIAQTREIGEQISGLDERAREIDAQLQQIALELPNIPDASTPIGKDENDNREIGKWGDIREIPVPQSHWEIAEKLNLIEFERATKISGSRFYALRGVGARLERALISFMLDCHTVDGDYQEILPPFLVNSASMTATGQLPKFGDDAYKIEGDDLWLIPTAEVPVTNLHREEILDVAELPIKYAAYSACFRREAGSAGRDTRGIIRVHQFNKVELVKFCTPQTSMDELDTLTRDAQMILQRLELPYRTVQLCSGDLGFSSCKTFDIEVWMPGQNAYREISSCSNFGDFQARRASIRYRPLDDGAPFGSRKAQKPEFVHTLNGSGLAVGRTMAALLENYQQSDGSVKVPVALRPYLGGLETIGTSQGT